MTKGQLQIHSENILPIIKRWLYSDHDIFVRELISNACDAIHKLKILRDQGTAPSNGESPRIDVTISQAEKTITFSDNGIGMDADEVVKYIAQIAFSGAEDFVKKYQTDNQKDQIIGHFGLGFYSAYMVADTVEVQTLSYKEGAEAVEWICDGSPEYTLEKGSRKAVGTSIILHVNKENEEFLEEKKLKDLLERYCRFLPYPIFINGAQLNEKEPLWVKSATELTDQDYKDFYKTLYPFQPEPLFWVHLNVDYPFHLKGILYFPKMERNFDTTKYTIQLYCNRVFVADNCKDVIPDFLIPLRGVIDSPDIPLNVSRSTLQMDRTVRQLSQHISKKVADSLVHLYTSDRERFLEAWEDIAVIIKIGAIENEKFYEKVKPCLLWKTVGGASLTAEDYLEKNRSKIGDTLLYTLDPSHQAPLLQFYQKQEIDVLVAGHPVDAYLINFLEKHLSPAVFKRLDASLQDSLLDPSREKSLLDESGKSEAARLADWVRTQLSQEKWDVEAKSLASEAIPSLIMQDENERRMREYMRSVSPDMPFPLGKKKLVVNTNHPLIHLLPKIAETDPELARHVTEEVADLALLSQREMSGDELNAFITRTQLLLEKMLTR